jgi:hypothetical protein
VGRRALQRATPVARRPSFCAGGPCSPPVSLLDARAADRCSCTAPRWRDWLHGAQRTTAASTCGADTSPSRAPSPRGCRSSCHCPRRSFVRDGELVVQAECCSTPSPARAYARHHGRELSTGQKEEAGPLGGSKQPSEPGFRGRFGVVKGGRSCRSSTACLRIPRVRVIRGGGRRRERGVLGVQAREWKPPRGPSLRAGTSEPVTSAAR